MLGASLTYFRRGEHGEQAVLTGSILSFLLAILLELGLAGTTALAVVPAVALAGYFARILAASADGEYEPPAFSFSVQLLRDGLRTVLVAGSYLLVPTLLLVLTVSGVLSAGEGGLDPSASLGIYAGSAAALFTALTFAYLVPAAIVLAIGKRSLWSAFRFRSLTSLIAHAAYLYAWAMALALVGLGLSVATGLTGVPIIGRPLAVLASFYTMATATHLVGRGCAKAMNRTR